MLSTKVPCPSCGYFLARLVSGDDGDLTLVHHQARIKKGSIVCRRCGRTFHVYDVEQVHDYVLTKVAG